MSTTETRPEAPPLRWPAGSALVVGFLVVALVDVVATFVLLPSPRGGLRVRGVQLLYLVGYDLAVGLLLSSIAEAWDRWGPRREALRRVAEFVAPAVAAALLVVRDVEPFASRLPGPEDAWAAALALAFGCGVPAAARVARLAARNRLLAIAAIVVGVAVAAVNHLVLVAGYSGVHLVVAWVAAMLAGAGLLHLVLGRVAVGRRSSQVGRAALAIAAAVAIAVAPSMTVTVELLRLAGHAPARFLGEARSRLDPGWAGAAVAGGGGEWWLDRSRRGDVAPTGAIELPDNPIVVLVTIDALRADVVNEGKHDARLPNLARLRDESVAFTRARSPASATAPAIGALFSGKYYSQLYWSEPKKKIKSRDGSSKVFLQDDTTVRFPAALTAAGVQTLNLAGTGGFTRPYGLVFGFSEEKKPGWSAHELIKAAVERVEASEGASLFVYLHCMEPHEGYDAPGKTPFERYLGEVEKVDAAMGDLVALTSRPGVGERLVIIVSADHGEAFGEHGTKFHAVTLYEELIRVPLLFRVPGVKPRRDATPISLIDVGPTVLDLMKVPIPGSNMGQSLAPVLAGKSSRLTRPLVADSGRRMQAMIFDDRYKIMRDLRQGTVELYDLEADPEELRNLSDDEPDLTADFLGRLASFFDVHTFRKKGYEVPYRP